MKKIFKILGIALLALLILLAATPFLFKAKIVGLLKEEINKNVKAKVDFSGASLNLFRSFPDFSLGINDLSVVGVGPFEKDTLAYFSSLRLTIDLMSVINGNAYEIKQILMRDPVINLITLPDLSVNWDITIPASEVADTMASDAAESPLSIKLNHIELSNGRLRYDDQSLAFETMLTGLSGSVSGDFTADVATLHTLLSAESMDLIYEKTAYLKRVKTKVDSKIVTDLKNSVYTFKETSMLLNQLAIGFEGSFEMPGDDIDMDLKFNAVNNNFGDLLSLVPAIYAAGMDKVIVAGNFSLAGFVKGTYTETKMPGFGLNLAVEGASFYYPDLPKRVEHIVINTSILNQTGDPDNTIIHVKNFDFEMGSSPFHAGLLLKTPVSNPDFEASFKGKLDLTGLADVMPIEKEDRLTGKVQFDLAIKGKKSDIDQKQYDRIDAKGTVEMNDFEYQSAMFGLPVNILEARLVFTPAFLEMEKFSTQLGKSDVAMTGKIENFLGYYLGSLPLVGKVQLKSNLLDVNELMASMSGEPESANPSDTTSAPLDLPANIDFTFNGQIEKLLYDSYELNHTKAQLIYRDKVLVFDPLVAEFIGGSVSMKGSFDGKDMQNPLIGFEFNLNDFDIPLAYKTIGMFQKAAPIAEKASGKFSTGFKLNGQLDSGLNPVYSSLTGGGLLKTTNLVVASSEALSRISTALGSEKYKQLKTDGLNFSFEILNGKVYLKPFDLKYAGADVTVGGFIDFDQHIDYDLLFKLPFDQLGSTVTTGMQKLMSEAEKKGLSVNPGTSVQVKAKVSGMASDPKIAIDYSNYGSNLKSGLEDMARKELEKQKEEVKAKVRDEAAKIIEDARKQGDALVKQAEISGAKIKSEATKSAEQVREEAEKQAQKIEKEGKAKGLIGEKLAKEAAKKVRKEGDDSANKIVAEGDKRADDLVKQARKQADDLLKQAQEKADKI
ncbi:MAG: AsmA family protein [Bacteroidetes bacterium]|nr:AsmA family protein [Bacteroidota bacterium]